MKLHDSLERARGHLESLDEARFDEIDFEWEGIHFHARSLKKGDDGGEIRLHAKLGQVYFTIEDELQRGLALERLFLNNRGVDGAYRMNRDGVVEFSSITTTDDHLAGAKLMSALTLILLESENHLRSLRAHLKPLD
ncbi:hypothetical protein [Pseudokordiimonas caeni]|uniref:hypothetical protein n=1 Tax=Pseudokordiimonas caeni TaxID=2997908 RepID=UPI0028127109|nr:hypothetical protein [Pseudokordiimonas caeni]